MRSDEGEATSGVPALVPAVGVRKRIATADPVVSTQIFSKEAL